MDLQEFLIQYRRTPLETGLSPCELLNGRQIRTRIDVLRPSPSHLANEVAGVNTSGRHNSRFAVGSPCYVKYFGPHKDRQPRWVPAIINQILGPRLFMVKSLMQGYSWKRHIDQIRPRFGVEQDSDPGEPVAEQPSTTLKSKSERPRPVQEPRPRKMQRPIKVPRPEVQFPSPVLPRRSERIRQQLNRQLLPRGEVLHS